MLLYSGLIPDQDSKWNFRLNTQSTTLTTSTEVPSTVGTSFCCVPDPNPVSTSSRPEGTQSASDNNVKRLFDPHNDDDEFLDEPDSTTISAQPAHSSIVQNEVVPSARKRARLIAPVSSRHSEAEMSATTSIRRDLQQPAVGHFAGPVRGSNTDEEMLAAISNRLDLQRRIAERYLNATSKPTAAEPIVTAPRATITSLDNHGGRFDSFREISQTSRVPFVPSASQQDVHQCITALHHQGKLNFLDGLITSRFVTFLPLPGVLVRIYDVQFRNRGLSIMHLLPADDRTRMRWQEDGGANIQALTSTTGAPKATRAAGIQDVVSACQTLSIYAIE
ncbi:hypothetical protein L914_08813 [Phytophthora nicotianae]|uniref:Uncharacterized protein n=1 Tax=Phytophthora nicotianae TaxID=4792 RepID=W2NCB3_PHYNI|nr:hypothetical protein L914_08813 [Phytophthora nicotianae]